MDQWLPQWQFDDTYVDSIAPSNYEAVIIPHLSEAMRLGPETPLGRAHLLREVELLNALYESAVRQFGPVEKVDW